MRGDTQRRSVRIRAADKDLAWRTLTRDGQKWASGKVVVPPVLNCALVGEIAIELTTGLICAAVTVTLLEADLVESATLVAVTVSVPALVALCTCPRR
jgi:hypothetical protein